VKIKDFRLGLLYLFFLLLSLAFVCIQVIWLDQGALEFDDVVGSVNLALARVSPLTAARALFAYTFAA
jgi:hypothetical protein